MTSQSTTHPHLPHLHHLSSAASLLTPISPHLAASTTDRLLTLLESRSSTDNTTKREITLTPSNLRTFCKACNASLVPGWSCSVRTMGGQDRYTVSKAIRKRMREEARKMVRKEEAKAERAGEMVEKEGEAARLRRKQSEKEKGIVLGCDGCGYKERIYLERPKAVRHKKGVKKTAVVVNEVVATTTTTKTTTVATPVAVSKSQTMTQPVQTTTIAQQGTAKARAKKRKQGLLSEVLAKKKKEDEAKARGGGLGGGLGGLDLMDLMKTG